MEFTFAMRQVSSVRDLYECAQKMESWLPAVQDSLSQMFGQAPAVEPRFIVLHDADSAGTVHRSAPFPVWADVEKGIINLCPDINEWKKLLQGWTASIPAENGESLKLERYVRAWSLRFLTCAVAGQALAKHYEPIYSLPRRRAPLWLYHGLAIFAGHRAWEISEPYLQEDAILAEQLLLSACQPSPTLNEAFDETLSPTLSWAVRCRAAAAARDLVEICGGFQELSRALVLAYPGNRSGAGVEPFRRLFRGIGADDSTAAGFLQRWNVSPEDAA